MPVLGKLNANHKIGSVTEGTVSPLPPRSSTIVCFIWKLKTFPLNEIQIEWYIIWSGTDFKISSRSIYLQEIEMLLLF